MLKSTLGQLSDIDLRLLRIFKTIVEAGGFSPAEAVLNISTAAISLAVTDLEARLGFRLCQRGRSGFSLTQEGSEVYQYILQVLASIENFRTQVNTLHHELRGELNIGITDNLVTMPNMHITESLAKLKDQGPEVIVNIRMIPPVEIELAVFNDKLQIGILPLFKELKGLMYQNLYKEKSLLYCSYGHPLFDSGIGQLDLSKWNAVLPCYAQSTQIKKQLQQLKIEGAASATDREGVAFLILTGRYIGYLPDHFANRWVKSGQLRALNPDLYQYQTQFSVVTRRGIPLNQVTQVYLDHLFRGSAEQEVHN